MEGVVPYQLQNEPPHTQMRDYGCTVRMNLEPSTGEILGMHMRCTTVRHTPMKDMPIRYTPMRHTPMTCILMRYTPACKTPNPHHGQNAAVLLNRLQLLVVAGLVSHLSFWR
jgi:hypothetical protein